MLRSVVRYGVVRLIGRRAVPALLAWDLAMLANRARQIPVVERGLRLGVGAAGRGLGSVVRRRGRSGPPGVDRAATAAPPPGPDA